MFKLLKAIFPEGPTYLPILCNTEKPTMKNVKKTSFYLVIEKVYLFISNHVKCSLILVLIYVHHILWIYNGVGILKETKLFIFILY